MNRLTILDKPSLNNRFYPLFTGIIAGFIAQVCFRAFLERPDTISQMLFLAGLFEILTISMIVGVILIKEINWGKKWLELVFNGLIIGIATALICRYALTLRPTSAIPMTLGLYLGMQWFQSERLQFWLLVLTGGLAWWGHSYLGILVVFGLWSFITKQDQWIVIAVWSFISLLMMMDALIYRGLALLLICLLGVAGRFREVDAPKNQLLWRILIAILGLMAFITLILDYFPRLAG